MIRDSGFVSRLRDSGPLTVAAFMELALYDPECGYYARSAQRSGRAGDFFTSVDVGPLFGELLERQLAEMAGILNPGFEAPFDLVEAGAGNGRLSADILRAARERDPAFYRSIRLRLVEKSFAARAAHRETLRDVGERLESSGPSLPESYEGVLIANELLDALPVHQVIMREEGLRELYVSQRRATSAEASAGPGAETLVFDLVEGPLSTPRLQEYLDRLGIALEREWRAEINLRATEWVREAARRTRRGFMILIDYGHAARELYSPAHSSGTLTTFSRHRSAGTESVGPEGARPAWLQTPGEQDITSHVDFTSVRAAAEAEGMVTLGFLDQTYFLIGLLTSADAEADASAAPSLRRSQQLKTLILPGGLGSTLKVLIMGKNVGAPSLRSCSFKVRVT